jgi:mycothiol synthase
MSATDVPVAGTGVVIRWEPAGHGQLDVGLRGDATDASPRVVTATVEAIAAITAAQPDRALRLIGNHPPDGPLPLPGAVAAALDLRPTRELHQLRRPLPVPGDHPGRAGAPPLPLRPFQPGRDEAAWLRANNAAFAEHPDQGGQTEQDLARTLAEPWVDLDGFLVSDDPDHPGELSGFCWTRVHPPTAEDPELGEIFVIGVAPAQHGRKLGATLVLAGLDHLAWTGVRTGMLYVEGDNEPAQKLYARLGFAPHLIIEMFT